MKSVKITCIYCCPSYKKEIARKTVKWCIKRLGLSKLKKLNIIVKIKSIEDCYGYCEEINHKDRKYNIAISNDQNLRYFVMTIIHEMTHVKQYVRNKWSGDGEREALINEEYLANELWKDNIL